MTILGSAEHGRAVALTPLDQARARMAHHTTLLAEHSAVQAELNEEAVVTFLEWMRDQRQVAPATVVSYAGVLARFLDECVRGRMFDAVPPEEVEAWLSRPRGGRARGNPPQAATKARNIAVLRSLYKFLTARGFCTRNVAALVAAPKVRNQQPKPIRDELWMDTFTSLPLDGRIAMGLMFFCGLRRAEVTALRGDQFDIGTGTIRDFLRKGGGDDSLPYMDVLAIFHRKLPHLLCGRSPQSIAREWEQRAQRRGAGLLLGFPPDGMNKRFLTWCDGEFTPHQLRHSAVTNLLRAGLPLDMVSWLMNHSSPAITMRYVKQSGSRLREWAERQP